MQQVAASIMSIQGRCAHHSEAKDGGHAKPPVRVLGLGLLAEAHNSGIIGPDGECSQQSAAGHHLHILLRQVAVVPLGQRVQLVPAHRQSYRRQTSKLSVNGLPVQA